MFDELPELPSRATGMTVVQSLYVATRWVQEQLCAGAPRPVWLVVPKPLPYIALLAQSLWACLGSRVRLDAPRGIPFRATPLFSRVDQLNKALAADLSVAALAQLLPYLRRGRGDAGRAAEAWLPRISPARALFLLHSCGAHPDPTGPHRWHGHIAAFLRRVENGLQALNRTDRVSQRTNAVQRHEAERVRRELRLVLPAVRALDVLADRLAAGGTLAELLEVYRSFVLDWLVLPVPSPVLREVFERAWEDAKENHAHLKLGEFLRWLTSALSRASIRPEPEEDPDVVLSAEPVPDEKGPLFRVHPGTDEEAFLLSPAEQEIVPLAPEWSSGAPALEWPSFQGPQRPRRAREFDDDADGVTRIEPGSLPRWGREARRPLSATALPMLLECPYRFLLERTAHIHPLPAPVRTDQLDPMAFGTLVHQAFSTFLASCGRAFYARENHLAFWLENVRAICSEQFDDFVLGYPLFGTDVREREHGRLEEALRCLVGEEWRQPQAELLGVEPRFGEPMGLCLSVGDRQLYLRGAMDWLLREPAGVAIRELKTAAGRGMGSVRPATRHYLQLGLYVLAAESGFLLPADTVVEAALLVVSGQKIHRWCARDDALAQLRQTTRAALELGMELLEAGLFPRTPRQEPCGRCPFFHHCGEEGAMRSAGSLRRSRDSRLQRFLAWHEVAAERLAFEYPG
ncbi:MAG: hypothetical protein KatS3mg077_1380 [Candidatus Binatia bacterium]|nr:MAG: hypothetical protein KatS3mg077_1380 [Candidatus Binatia bacterium]